MTTPTPNFFKAEASNFDLQAFKERLTLKLSDLCELIKLKLGPEILSERCLILTINDKALNERYTVEVLFQPELGEEEYTALIRERIVDLKDDEEMFGTEPLSEAETERFITPSRHLKK